MRNKHERAVIAGAVSSTAIAISTMIVVLAMTVSGAYRSDNQQVDESQGATFPVPATSRAPSTEAQDRGSQDTPPQDRNVVGATSPIVRELGNVAIGDLAIATPDVAVDDVALPRPVATLASDTVPIYYGPGPSVSAASLMPSCPSLIIDKFGDNSYAACAISFCESGWSSSATGAAGEDGWFQLHPVHQARANAMFGTAVDMHDPVVNVDVAYVVSGGGVSWGPWSVRSVLSTGVCPNGARPPIS